MIIFDIYTIENSQANISGMHAGILDGEGDVLCLAFSGDLICLGLAGGAVVVFDVANSYEAWKRYHQGAVGCMAVVPSEGGGEGQRVLTGSADRRVRLWDRHGELVSTVELGAQVMHHLLTYYP